MSGQQTIQFEWKEVTDVALMRTALAELAKLSDYKDNPNETLYAFPLGKAVEYFVEQTKINIRKAASTAIPSTENIKQINSIESTRFYKHYNNDPPAPREGPPKYDDTSPIIEQHMRPIVLKTAQILLRNQTSGWGKSLKEVSVVVNDPNTKEEYIIAPANAFRKFECEDGKARLPKLTK